MSSASLEGAVKLAESCQPYQRPWSSPMIGSHEQPLTEPEAQPAYPWVEATLCTKDHTAFLMGLGEIVFAVLLAELDARRLAVIATCAPGDAIAGTEDGGETSASTRFNDVIRL